VGIQEVKRIPPVNPVEESFSRLSNENLDESDLWLWFLSSMAKHGFNWVLSTTYTRFLFSLVLSCFERKKRRKILETRRTQFDSFSRFLRQVFGKWVHFATRTRGEIAALLSSLSLCCVILLQRRWELGSFLGDQLSFERNRFVVCSVLSPPFVEENCKKAAIGGLQYTGGTKSF
jgi:hypothetical protein